MAALQERDVLTNCSVTKLADAKILKITNKHIVQIDVLRNCTALGKVDLSRNEIEDATSLKKFKKLTWLNLAYNKLSSMSFVDKMTNLTVLNLSNNQISDMSPVATLNSLCALILSGNCIREVCGLKSLKKLNTLVLSSNNISSVDISFLGSLVKLQLSHNQLKNFPNVKFNEDLKQLSLNDNLIESIPAKCLDDNSIEILELGKNQIKSVKQIKSLQEMSTLQQLNLKGNALCETEDYLTKVMAMFPDLRTFNSKPFSKMKGNPEQSQSKTTKEQQSTSKIPGTLGNDTKRPAVDSDTDSSTDGSTTPRKKQKKYFAQDTSPNHGSLSQKLDMKHKTKMEKSLKHSTEEKKKSKKQDLKESRAKSGVVAMKEIKVKKHSADSRTDIFSVLDSQIGQGIESSW